MARHAGPKAGRVSGAHAARHHGAIRVGELVRQGHEARFFRQEKVGVTAVSLPAIGGALWLVAADHPPAATVGAQPAALDMVDDDAVATLELAHPGADFFNYPGRLMAGDDAFVCFGTGPLLGRSVNGAQVTAAEGGCFHTHQDLPMLGL